MNMRKHQKAVLRIFTIALAVTGLAVPVLAADGARPTLSGSVAYAEPMRFDYDKDGIINDVQLWSDFDIKPAVGKEGDPGYVPKEGYLRRYMKDLALNAPVIGYNNFNMLPDNPLGDKVPVSNITISGNTATFTVNDAKFTLVDGGRGFEHDSITVNDGIREYSVSLFAGDIVISQ
jgi:hypothetical protein